MIGARLADASVRLLSFVVRHLPHAVQKALVNFIASLAWHLRIRRRIALRNAERVLVHCSSNEQRHIVQSSYASMAHAATEAMGLIDAERSLVVPDWKGIDRLIARNQPAIIVSAHLGSWELIADALVAQGAAVSAVVRPLRGALNKRIFARRKKLGVEMISARGAVFEVLKALRKKRMVVQLIDQWISADSGVEVPFMGLATMTSPLVALAALRSKAPVYVVVSVVRSNETHLCVEGPLVPTSTGNLRADITNFTATLSRTIGDYVRRFPEQWLWLHRRWKNLDALDRKPQYQAGLKQRGVAQR